MTRQPRPERWTQIVVAKPICAPMRSVITGALDPYGIVYRASYEYAIKTIDPRKLPKGEIERSGGLVMCYVAKIQVRERAAVWAEYLLLRTHRLMLLSPPKHPRNARWVAKFDLNDMPKPLVEPGCTEGTQRQPDPPPDDKRRHWLARIFGRSG